MAYFSQKGDRRRSLARALDQIESDGDESALSDTLRSISNYCKSKGMTLQASMATNRSEDLDNNKIKFANALTLARTYLKQCS